MWQVVKAVSGEQHVVPVEDMSLHHATPLCSCKPVDDEGVWVHNSWDRREFAERGEIRKN